VRNVTHGQAGLCPVEQATSERFAPAVSVAPDAYAPGDFILTHGTAWTSWFIRFGQRIRFRGKDRRYAHSSHAALIVSGSGDLIEAPGAAVQKRNIEVYKQTEYYVSGAVGGLCGCVSPPFRCSLCLHCCREPRRRRSTPAGGEKSRFRLKT
jgi:hypothetical protein